MNWGDKYSAGPEGPPRLIVHKECGGVVNERGICESCGETLHARDARQVAGPGWDARLLAAAGAAEPSCRLALLAFAALEVGERDVLLDHLRSFGRLAARFIAIRWSSEATRTSTPSISHSGGLP